MTAHATRTAVRSAPAVPCDAAQRSYPLVAALVRVAMRYREDNELQVVLLGAAAALVEAGRVMALDEEWLDEAREWCANVARGNGRGR